MSLLPAVGPSPLVRLVDRQRASRRREGRSTRRVRVQALRPERDQIPGESTKNKFTPGPCEGRSIVDVPNAVATLRRWPSGRRAADGRRAVERGGRRVSS